MGLTTEAKPIAVRLDPDRRADLEAYGRERYPGLPPAALVREIILAAMAGPPPAAPGPIPVAPGGLSKAQVIFLGTLLSTETSAEVADLYARVVEGREGPVTP